MNGKTTHAQAELVALQQVKARIAAACASSNRNPSSVQLLAVGKTFAAEHLIAFADLGQHAFGENYLQEALDKQQQIQRERPDLQLEWHFIGPIQSNKTRAIAEHFDWVHSVERSKIARRLNEQRDGEQAPLNVCIQVNIDESPTKSGCLPDEALALAREITGLPQLVLRGLMAIPDPSDDRAVQARSFAAVRTLLESMRTELAVDYPQAAERLDTLSMGMTADLEVAIAEGATMVRVGTALFGARARQNQS